MADSTSTIYPKIQPADPSQLSLADLPLEIVLRIIETLFDVEQIIVIELFRIKKDAAHTNGDPSFLTEVILHTPPLYKLSTVCRLFRHMYRRSRPTLWGAHLEPSRGRAYYVDLKRDIFYAHLTPPLGLPGQFQVEVLDGLVPDGFAGVQRMASPFGAFNPHMTIFYLRTMSPSCKELLFLKSVRGLEARNLSLAPVMLPLGDEVKFWQYSDEHNIGEWGEYKKFVLNIATKVRLGGFLSEHAPSSVQTAPAVPEIRAFAVDERRLISANRFHGESTRMWWGGSGWVAERSPRR